MPTEQVAIKTMDEIEAITTTKPVPVGAAAAFTELLAGATPAMEYTGNVPLLEKDKLRGVPLLVVGYKVNTAEQGAKGGADAAYAFVRCMLPNGAYIGFNDGGSSIPPVLEAHANAIGATVDDQSGEVTFGSPLFSPRGLIRSDYEGEYGPATTYHLS